MKKVTACNRELFVEKLKELNFYGPVFMNGQHFMLYHGQALSIPKNTTYTISQFRFLLREVESMVSKEEWGF